MTDDKWRGFDSWIQTFEQEQTEEQERLDKVMRAYPIKPLTVQEKAALFLRLGIVDTQR